GGVHRAGQIGGGLRIELLQHILFVGGHASLRETQGCGQHRAAVILLPDCQLSWYAMHQPPASKPSLGEYLRARREQLRPEDFGLPPGQRRRTPGLRREEVAQLCGISVTWLTWIEQGRTTAISVPTLAAIARGLRFSHA